MDALPAQAAWVLCPLSLVFTLPFVPSRHGWEEMQRVDVSTSCVHPVYLSWIMDSVSYLLLLVWEGKVGWGSWKCHCGVGCSSVWRVFGNALPLAVPVHGLEDHIFIAGFLCSPGHISDPAFVLAHITGRDSQKNAGVSSLSLNGWGEL